MKDLKELKEKLKVAKENLGKQRDLWRKLQEGKLNLRDGGANVRDSIKKFEEEVAVLTEQVKGIEEEMRRNAQPSSAAPTHVVNGTRVHGASDDEAPMVAEARVRSVFMARPNLTSTKRFGGTAMVEAVLAQGTSGNNPTPKAQTASTSYAMQSHSTPRLRNTNYGNVQDWTSMSTRTPASAPPAVQTQQSARVASTQRRARTTTTARKERKKKDLRCCVCKDAIDSWRPEAGSKHASKLMCDECREAKLGSQVRHRDDSGAEQPQSAPAVSHRRLRKLHKKADVVKNLETEALDLVSDDEHATLGPAAATTQDAPPPHTDVDVHTNTIPTNTNTNNINNQHSMALRSTLRRSLQNRVVLYPGREDPYAVEVRGEDLDRLGPCEFLNDTIIDMYIKYIQQHLEPEQRHRFHFFNSFFFKKLSERTQNNDANGGAALTPRKRQHSRVKNWTKSVDIFAKDYLFMPIHGGLHWSLAIICHPGLCDSDDPKEQSASCILHLDSMKSGHDGISLSRHLRGYLENEWAHRLHVENSVAANSNKKSRQFGAKTLPFHKAQVPQQDNEYDCGLFLLHYMELFAQYAPKRFNLEASMVNKTWFKSQEIVEKRTMLYKLLASLFGVESTGKEETTPDKEETSPPEQASVPGDGAVDGDIDNLPKQIDLPEQIERIYDEKDKEAAVAAGVDDDVVAATTNLNGHDQDVGHEAEAGVRQHMGERSCDRRKRRRLRGSECSDVPAQAGFQGIDAQLTQSTQAQAVQT